MKAPLLAACWAVLLQAAPGQEALTLEGTGLCAKCALGRTDECRNAIRTVLDGEERILLLTPSEASKAFHRNICMEEREISITGRFEEIGGERVFDAVRLALLPDDVVRGEGLCLKCALGLTAQCQNGIRAKEEGRQVLYFLDHNQASQDFHSQVCRQSLPVAATGRAREIGGLPQIRGFRARSIEAAGPAAGAAGDKPPAGPEEEAPPVVLKGEGMCAKCELGLTGACRNALRLEGGDILLLAHNQASQEFHATVCSSVVPIVVSGRYSGEGEDRELVPGSYSVQEPVALEGIGACLKCHLGQSRVCRNAVRVAGEQGEEIYILDQNEASRSFHRHLCLEEARVRVEGTLARIGGRLEVTASSIGLGAGE